MILSTSVSKAEDLPALVTSGFTLFQTDSDHLSTEETASGVWDFSRAEADRRPLRQRGLDWCYFPHYAFPPKWYRDQSNFTRLECLEHNQPVQAFSPWDPKFTAYVTRAFQKLSDQFPMLPSLYLGVHGDYGESGLLMGARTEVPGQKEEWQQRFGNLHNHLGWWCGDTLARASFREAMLKKYGSMEALNAAWKTRFSKKEQIAYPTSPANSDRRYWLDFENWYLNSVSSITETICKTARKRFPGSLLMLPAGFASENPRGGNDNSQIVKIAAKYKVDVRSTHAEFKPFAQNQASMMGRLASACRFYGAPFWTEPPGRLTQDQELERIFAAASLGSKGVFDWADNARDNREIYYRNGKYLRIEKPVVDVAMFFPTTSHLLRPDNGYPQTFLKACSDIRDVLNYDIVDERMIMDGALERYRILVLWEGMVVEGDTLAKLRDWVQAGGVLAAYDFGKIETVEGDKAWFNDLFGFAGKLTPARPVYRFVPPTGQRAPTYYRIPVGEPEAGQYLTGDWFEPEMSGRSTWRWTGASADIILPIDPALPATISIQATFPPEAARFKREALLNGVTLGALDRPGENRYVFPVPPRALRDLETATLTIRCQPWTPANLLPGSTDKRSLGVWVSTIQMDNGDHNPAVEAPPLAGRLESSLDLKRLTSEWARPYGKGWTVFYPSTRRNLAGFYEIVRYLTYHLSDLDKTKHDAIAVDDAWDGVYATLLTDRILYYNPGARPVARSIVLSPEAFAANPDLMKPAKYTNNLILEPNGIAAINLEPLPQELLLPCEKFLELGPLRPLPGNGFHPGAGPTHVLVPAGARIGTRFEIEVAGEYRIYYRAVRQNAKAYAEVLIDDRSVSGQHPTPPPFSDTRLAGIAKLAAGKHTLIVGPRKGEDIRADFVVLTNDPTIGGYRFAVKPTPRASGL